MIRLARPISPRLPSSSLLPSSSSSSLIAAAASCCSLHRRSIVTHISPTTSLLRSNANENEIYLLGTAHVSDESTREVIELINLVQPTTVFVELDSGRAAQLRRSSAGSSNAGATTTTTTTFDDLSSITKHTTRSQARYQDYRQTSHESYKLLHRIYRRIYCDKLVGFHLRVEKCSRQLLKRTRLGIRCVHR